MTHVEMQLTVQGTVEDFDQASFRSSLGAYLKVSPADMSLSVSAASVNVKATIVFADASAAGSVADTMQGLASNLTALSAVVGVTVEGATDPVVSQLVILAPSPPPLSLLPSPPSPPSPPPQPAPPLPSLLKLSATANLSSTYSQSYSASKCVDDDRYNFCHSEERVSDPSLTLDLGMAIQVAYIAVYNRRDCCRTRLGKYTVSYRVRSADAWSVCAEATGNAYALGPLLSECSHLARYIRVQLPGAGRTLNLAEVEAYSFNPPPPPPSPPLRPPSPPSPPSPSPSPPRCTGRNTFANKVSLQTAVKEYDSNVTSAIAKYGLIADWCVSGVTDMSWLFYYLRNFNADISSWDTSRVTNMLSMFRSTSAFNQPLSLDTSSVMNMAYMFRYARAFNQPLSLDTSNVRDLSFMFDSASAFNQPLSLNTSNVGDMYAMFRSASAFNRPLSLDTSRVTRMTYMFRFAAAFNQPLSLDTSSVTAMNSMFDSASAFNQPLSLDTSSVTNMAYMVRSAAAFNQPLNLDTSSVTSMGSMFAFAVAFNQPLNLDTSSVKFMRDMFASASAFNQQLSLDTSKVTNMYSMFDSALAFNQPLSFDTSRVTNMGAMFAVRSARVPRTCVVCAPTLSRGPRHADLPHTPPFDSAGGNEVKPSVKL